MKLPRLRQLSASVQGTFWPFFLHAARDACSLCSFATAAWRRGVDADTGTMGSNNTALHFAPRMSALFQCKTALLDTRGSMPARLAPTWPAPTPEHCARHRGGADATARPKATTWHYARSRGWQGRT